MDTSEQTSAPQVSSGIEGDKPGLEQVREWLIVQVAQRLSLKPSEVDSRRPLAEFGLDSKDAVNLSRQLGEFSGKSLSPTLVWRYPSIEQLAEFVSKA